MTRLTPISARELIKKLKRMGFVFLRQKGSHSIWRHPDGRIVVVPVHKGEDISRGLLRCILNDIDVSVEEFFAED